MYWSRLFPLSLLLLLESLVDCQQAIPATDNPECISEAKSERLEILANLLDLKSSIGSLSGGISYLDRRVRSIENLVKDTEVKTTKKIDGLERQLQELTGRVTAEAADSPSHESLNLLSLEKQINTSILLIRGLEEPLAKLRNQTQALLVERREEKANCSWAAEVIAPTLQTLGNLGNLTYAQMNYQTGTILTGAERTAKIETILYNPKATFFRGQNQSGGAVKYDSTNSTFKGGCHHLHGMHSMKTSESCVRVFKEYTCIGSSRALYPKASTEAGFINLLTTESPSGVNSVGPCLPNEFQYAKVSLNGCKVAITKDESNARQVPDIADFQGFHEYYPKSTKVNSSSSSLKYYYMDAQGRPKWIRADVHRRHINNKTGVAVKGLAIPPGLGGPRNETFNRFPQTERNFEEWKLITDQIRQSRITHPYGSHSGSLTFLYDSSANDKPYGFYYWISFDIPGRMGKIAYGFIEN